MNKSRFFVIGLALLLSFAIVVDASGQEKKFKTENIIFVMTDGLRWQEVFQGAEESLLPEAKSGIHPVRAAYWRDTPEERREALMPFTWQVMAREGQIFGNQDKGSVSQVTNGYNFSYPGFSEVACGFGYKDVDSNNKIYNPHLNVFEFLNNMPEYKDRIGCFGAWELFPWILNRQRSGMLVNAGYEPLDTGQSFPEYELLNRMKRETIHYWGGEPFDSITFETAFAYFKREQPRVLFVVLGETDEWPHGGRYDLYLHSARHADNAVRLLWETAQSMDQYRDKTTLIYSTDHGRGYAPVEWKSHGEEIANSENTWMAFMGPDTEALGERENVDRVTASQIAATLAAFLGEDFRAAVPEAGKPIDDVLGK
jgi:hypothetical protein